MHVYVHMFMHACMFDRTGTTSMAGTAMTIPLFEWELFTLPPALHLISDIPSNDETIPGIYVRACGQYKRTADAET